MGLTRLDSSRELVALPTQSLVLTLVSDYWSAEHPPLPSAALVALLGEFDITEHAARAALSRLSRRGMMVVSKQGRRTFHNLSAHGQRLLHQGMERFVTFEGEAAQEWDGRWAVASFSIPEEQRHIRHVVRTRLRWHGFAPLYDGTWVSPWVHKAGLATEVFADQTVDSSTVFIASVLPDTLPTGSPVNAWQLDEIAQEYRDFIAEYQPLLERLDEGETGTREALWTRTNAVYTWRRFHSVDPGLPVSMLPDDWPRAEAREIFTTLYDQLGPLAEARVRQHVATFEPDLAGQVSHSTVEDIARSLAAVSESLTLSAPSRP